MKRIITILTTLICFLSISDAEIIKVPGDQPSIQAGIDAASDGDTVLVADSTYYENIDFKGKTITVASHFLMDGDTSHISKTKIDGSQPTDPDRGTTVTMESCKDTTSVLCGFTVTGGMGSVRDIAPDIKTGGGILCIFGGGKIESTIIRKNHLNAPRHGLGGGIFCYAPDTNNLVIRKNVISENTIESQWGGHGGGIELNTLGNAGFALIEGNTISNNTINSALSCAGGGGLRIFLKSPTTGYEVIARNNIIRDNRVDGFEYSPVAYGGGINIAFLLNDNTLSDPDPNPWFYNNVVSNNESEYVGGGMAITTWMDADSATVMNIRPVIINNTFYENSAPEAAGLFNYDAHPFLMNNIFWDDLSLQGSTEFAAPDLTPPLVEGEDGMNQGRFTAVFNNIQGGWDGWGNIDSIPDFEPGTFTLAEGSPGIGHGKHSIEVDGIMYHTPESDLQGNSRPDRTFVDMGAIESPYLRPYDIVSVRDHLLKPGTDPISLYPNPCRDHLTIHMSNNVPIRRVEILGLDGRILRVADNLHSNSVTIERGDLPSGLYILRIQAEELYIEKLLVE